MININFGQHLFYSAQLERAIGGLFGVIGVAFAFLTIKQSGVLGMI
jgi:hypothetical protein